MEIIASKGCGVVTENREPHNDEVHDSPTAGGWRATALAIDSFLQFPDNGPEQNVGLVDVSGRIVRFFIIRDLTVCDLSFFVELFRGPAFANRPMAPFFDDWKNFEKNRMSLF